MSNTLGNIFKITSFGESHGAAVGVVIDGCPSGLKLNFKSIQKELDRRKPGQSKITTQRNESDNFEIISGIFEGITTGSPITIIIKNEDAKSKDYEHLKNVFRPSHADFTYQSKYQHRDHRGGGRSSARITAGWVAAGAVAKQVINQISKIKIYSYVNSVGKIELKKHYTTLNLNQIDKNIVRCPDEETAQKMEKLIAQIRKKGDTVGGTIVGIFKNMPVGLGEPVFDKFQANLGKAMLSINAVKGFEIGSGFEGSKDFGSQQNDIFISSKKNITTLTNNSGGIQGGITNGQDVYFKVAFKPVATLMQEQETTDANGKKVTLKGKGRHDPCVLPRAVPIVDALSAITLADFLLLKKINKL